MSKIVYDLIILAQALNPYNRPAQWRWRKEQERRRMLS